MGDRSFGGATIRRAVTAISDLGERPAFRGAINRMAVTAIADIGERHGFRGATNRMAVTAIVHLGEHCSFRGATNKSAAIAPLNENMKKAFRKWQFSHPKCDQNWQKKSAQLVIPVRSTFQNDLHPLIGGPHRQLDFI